MLRLLIASAARTNSGSLLTSANRRVYVSIERGLRQVVTKRTEITPLESSLQPKAEQSEGPTKSSAATYTWEFFNFTSSTLGAMVLLAIIVQFFDKEKCDIDLVSSDEQDKSVKKPGSKLVPKTRAHFHMAHPTIEVNEGRYIGEPNTKFTIFSKVIVTVPYAVTTDYKKICDELERQGIHVERTEEGARRGINELAIKYMQEGAAKHRMQDHSCGVKEATPLSKGPPIVYKKSSRLAKTPPPSDIESFSETMSTETPPSASPVPSF